jgi:uncharacterized iron-regulated membrane protein
MFKMKLYRWCRKIHKWMGLLIGIQVLFWILGGLVMSALPIDKVHGDHLHQGKGLGEISMTEYKISVVEWLQTNKVTPKSIRFYRVKDQPVVEIRADKKIVLSGVTGKRLSVMSEENIAISAQKLFTGNETITEMKLIKQLPREAGRLPLPVWKIVFDDLIDTTFYMDAYTGELLKVRSDLWRVFDFFWMLHIMDYETRDDFNNPLLISFAACALIFTITGLILLFQVFRKQDFTWRKPRPRKASARNSKPDKQ